MYENLILLKKRKGKEDLLCDLREVENDIAKSGECNSLVFFVLCVLFSIFMINENQVFFFSYYFF
jgi:hypothetical protein